MTMRTTKTALLSIASLLAFTSTLLAQDHLIENQRYVVGIDDFSWGDTYVGKYTSNNGLIIKNFVDGGNTNEIELTVQSLQIGSEANYSNEVFIGEGGTLIVSSDFSILAATNNNGLLIGDKGTLFMESDFDASMAGFSYTNGANLKVGGEVSNLDNVEGGLNFTLTGENATWNFGTNILTIGALTDANSVSISNQANVDINNIVLGSGGTTSNSFVISDGGRAFVQDSISILGADNFLRVTNEGILAVDFNFDASVGVDLEYGGILEAHQNLIFGSITNGGGIIMDGTNATWSNLSGSTLSVGGTNDNSLYIQNGATVRVGDLVIGDPNTESNNVFVRNGGRLILETGIGGAVTRTNRLWITDGGILTLEDDENIFGYTWNNGGIIEAYGRAPFIDGVLIGDEYVENGGAFLNDGQILKVIGPLGFLDTSGYNLHIGDLSANNALIITNGAFGIADSISIGDFMDASDSGEGGNHNSILVTGTNSILNSSTYVAIGGTIDNGNWIDGGISNSITVDNAGLLSVGTTLHNRNTTDTSGLNIKPGGRVTADDYYQASGAYLNIYTDASGINAGLLSVTNTAEFESGAKVGFDAVAALNIGQTYTNKILEAGTLIVNGVTNATTADLSPLDATGGSLVNYDLMVQSQDIYATFTRRSIADAGGITDSMLTQISDEIDRLAGLGNAAASNQVAILSLLSNEQAKREMEQLYSYQLPTYMHNQGIFGGIDQVRARGSSFHGNNNSTPLARPSGVSGPPGLHSGSQELQPWIKVYGSYGNRDEDNNSGFVDGYDVQAYGTVLGVDKSFGSLLLGVAGGYAGSNLEGDNNDKSDATTGYGLIYGSFGTNDWFGDVVLSYGLTDMDNESGGAFDVKSSVDASQTAFYIGGGKEFKDPDGSDARLRPLFGLQVSLYDQDAYSETSTTAVGKEVDAYERWSYQSTLGVSMMIPTKGVKANYETEFRAYWLHEFNDDEETVDYTLVGSSQPGQFILRAPDQNVGQFGLGFMADCKKTGLKLRLDLDGQVSKTFTSATVSGALLYEF